jgi:hypothetical protein
LQFAFKFNLYRYATVPEREASDLMDECWYEEDQAFVEVGLYTSNAVDPQLESAWFQPLNTYQVRDRFQAFAFSNGSTCAATSR